jgi:uncharacterized protein (DUF1810 family)
MEERQEKDDPYALQRFVDAQFSVYGNVCDELGRGQKVGHWMWFIFPQIKGLGINSTSLFYAISGREEARAYLSHPILGPRLRECTKLVNAIQRWTIKQIFHISCPDDLKFRSCMTLFSEVASDNEEFLLALRKYFGGQPDPATLERL